MLVPNKRQRRIYVEMAPRTGAATWGSFVDITPWFLEQLDDISEDVDDVSFEGRIEQSTVSLLFNNIRGNFRNAASNALWTTSQYIYHSRIKYYDWTPDQDSTAYGTKPTVDPVIDGLISYELDYKTDDTVVMTVSSRLDILKEHYFLDGFKGRVRTATSQSIIKKVIDLFDNTYSALGVTTNGGVVRNSILYTDITPYDKNLLQMLYEVIDQGGGIGGLFGDDLFFSYYDFDTENSVDTVTQANFSTDANTILLYQYDATDYGSGSGTTLDDKSANGYDATVEFSTGVTDIWSTEGFFGNYKARNFYYENDDGASGTNFTLTDFTVEMVINIDSFNVPVWPISSFGYFIAPIIAFCEQDAADVTCFQNVPSGQGSKKVCGLTLNEKGEVLWVSGDSSTDSTFSPKSLIRIDTLPGETSNFYLALSFDQSTGIYSYYLDGVLRNTFTDTQGYDVDDLSAVNKIVVRGYADGSERYLDKSVELYTSGFRLSNNVRSAADIYNNYLKVYGQELDIYTIAATFDDYSNKSLLRIDKYTPGIEQVKNFVIYEENKDAKGALQIAWDDAETTSFQVYIKRKVDYNVNVTAMSGVVDYINWVDQSNTTLFNQAEALRETYGFSAELGGALGSYSSSVILKVNGSFDYRSIMIKVFDADVSKSIALVTDTDRYYAAPTSNSNLYYNCFFSPADANTFILSKDDTSITSYGKRIYRIPNYELINTTLDKELMTANVLADKASPKPRCWAKVPYRSTGASVFSQIKLSINKKNTHQIPHMFQEGSVWQDWTLNGSYREKTFFVVGVRHDKDGKYTQLKLREV